MLVKGQKVEMKWSTSNREWYESKGYVFTQYRGVFVVSAEDLSPTSKCKVKTTCDYCGDEYVADYAVYYHGYNIYPKTPVLNVLAKKLRM